MRNLADASRGIVVADVARLPLADKSVDLVFGSPPYCDARTYGIDAQRDCQEWIDWMLDVTAEALRVCKGPVVWVAAGVTRDRCYWPACEGLMYEWWRRGGSMYRPCYWHKVGIPGSGGDQWFRADVEYVMCFKRAGPLPWTDNTAMGHVPKWAPGGEMSHRLSDGARVNKWGSIGDQVPSRMKDGKRAKKFRRDTDNIETQAYSAPAKANPGNLIRVHVGGGLMGDDLAHQNEAPFPEKLAEWFIRSLCPEGGVVLDPFSGSGTTAAVAREWGRRYIASDIRMSQALLTRRRLAQGLLFEEACHD